MWAMKCSQACATTKEMHLMNATMLQQDFKPTTYNYGYKTLFRYTVEKIANATQQNTFTRKSLIMLPKTHKIAAYLSTLSLRPTLARRPLLLQTDIIIMFYIIKLIMPTSAL